MDLFRKRIAVLGSTGSGKTALFAAWWHHVSENHSSAAVGVFANSRSVDVANQLKLLGRRLSATPPTWPPSTKIAHLDLECSLQVNSRTLLRFHWFDYPGGWLDRAHVSSDEEVLKMLQSLIDADAALLLVDGEKYARNGTSYVSDLIQKLKRSLDKVRGSRAWWKKLIDHFPREWVMVVTKSDSIPLELQHAGGFAEVVGAKCATELEDFNATFKTTLGSSALMASALRNETLDLILPVCLLTSIGTRHKRYLMLKDILATTPGLSASYKNLGDEGKEPGDESEVRATVVAPMNAPLLVAKIAAYDAAISRFDGTLREGAHRNLYKLFTPISR